MIEFSRVIAHRGASMLAPENTLAALQSAASAGAKWVEFDVQLSKDDQVIIFHDNTLGRTTNGYGLVSKTIWRDLQQLDCGAWFSSAFQSERVPTLEQWLRLSSDVNININIEIKGRYHRKVLVEKTLRILSECWPKQQAKLLISSFSLNALKQVCALSHDQVPVAVNLQRWPFCLPGIIKKQNCVSVHLDSKIVNPKRVAKLKSLGKKVAVFTVNEKEEAQRLFSMGVDAVFSDDLSWIDLVE